MQIQEKRLKTKNNYREIEITNFKEKRLFLMSKSLKVIVIIPTLNTNNFNIKFVWKILRIIFEIIINLLQFFWEFKISINDVIEFFFVMNFHLFAKVREVININRIF